MKWVHFVNVPMYVNKDGEIRESEPWIDCEELIADSGRRKGIKMMDMTMSVVTGGFICPDAVYLHFVDQTPRSGIRVAFITKYETGLL